MLTFIRFMLALCSMLTAADYAQINACLISAALIRSRGPRISFAPVHTNRNITRTITKCILIV